MNKRPRKVPRKTPWMAIGFFPATVATTIVELNTIRDYLGYTSSFLEGKKARFEKYLREAASALQPGEESELYDYHDDDIQQHWFGFPALLHGSMVVAVCSCLEAGLTDVCKDLQRETELTIAQKWEDIPKSETGIHRAAFFLERNFDIYPKQHLAWSRIMDYYRVRDCIAHAIGDVGLMRDTHQQAINSALSRFTPGDILVGRTGRLEMAPQFVEHILTDMDVFWRDLHDAFEENELIGPLYWP